MIKNTVSICSLKMTSSNEFHILTQVTSEIDESEIKITFANQCIKAQEALANKLKEEIKRRREICNSKKNENLKLEAEIRNAELEIENLRITHKTIRNTDNEIKKDLLLTKVRKNELLERIKIGEQKYEEIWIQCKKRYESIPLVKKMLKDRKATEVLNTDIAALESELETLKKAYLLKKDSLAVKDRQMVIQLAEFMVHEIPAILNAFKEKSSLIEEITKEIEKISKERNEKCDEIVVSTTSKSDVAGEKKAHDQKWSIDNTLMIPKLQLPTADMDMINFKLDINKVTLYTSPVKRSVSITQNSAIKRSKVDNQLKDNYISCYFKKSGTKDDEKQKEEVSEVNYSNKKLINILEDIHIDENETYKLVADADIDKLQEVNVITPKNAKEVTSSKNTPLETDEIEEIDLTNTNNQDVLIPPTQFLDMTKGTEDIQVQAIVHVDAGEIPFRNLRSSQEKEKSSQEARKKVTFDFPLTNQPVANEMTEDLDRSEYNNPNDSTTSQLDLSAVTDDNYMAIKDMILKKHQLDLSPQFVYAKNVLQKKNVDEIITSKFFESETKSLDKDTVGETGISKATVQEVDENEVSNNIQHNKKDTLQNIEENNDANMDINDVVSSPKTRVIEKPITGLLFTHGPQGITDLDISMSTTGYEEGDSDFPQCLDSSLLLSPKADLPLPMSGNGNDNEVISQDVPNFLSGFRKTGLSFFKQMPSEQTPDTCQQSEENNFSFKFGGDDKKNRGGLFSFFR